MVPSGIDVPYGPPSAPASEPCPPASLVRSVFVAVGYVDGVRRASTSTRIADADAECLTTRRLEERSIPLSRLWPQLFCRQSANLSDKKTTMDESETRSIELNGGEARTVVSALSATEGLESERESEEMTNIQRQIQTEFGFGERGDDEGAGFSGTVLGESREETDAHLNEPTGGSSPQSVELSRGEAKTVIAALSDFEGSQSADESTRDIRERFESTFDLGGSGGESDEGLL